MASRKTRLAAAAMVLVATASLLVPATASRKKETFTVGDDYDAWASGKKFTVGDAAGWDINVDYNHWKSGKKFKVGDTLLFRPKSPEQDVVQVDEKSFDDCVTRDNARVLSTGDAVTVELGESGKYFFICDAEGECTSGMKLAINVQ